MGGFADVAQIAQLPVQPTVENLVFRLARLLALVQQPMELLYFALGPGVPLLQEADHPTHGDQDHRSQNIMFQGVARRKADEMGHNQAGTPQHGDRQPAPSEPQAREDDGKIEQVGTIEARHLPPMRIPCQGTCPDNAQAQERRPDPTSAATVLFRPLVIHGAKFRHQSLRFLRNVMPGSPFSGSFMSRWRG